MKFQKSFASSVVAFEECGAKDANVNVSVVQFEGDTEYTEETLEKMCMKEMAVYIWDECPTIASRFPTCEGGGALLGSFVGKYYFRSRSHTQAIFAPLDTTSIFGPLAEEMVTPWGVLLLRRAPGNRVGEGVNRDRYEKGMYVKGFHLESRSAMILLEVPDCERWCNDPRARWVYGAATCWESWLQAKRKQPNNPQLTISEKIGFPRCIDLRPKTPSDIRSWCCNQWNSNQSDSEFNVVQYAAKIQDYATGFLQHMSDNGWDLGFVRDTRCESRFPNTGMDQ